MPDPGVALGVFLLLVLAVTVLLWPRHGVVDRLRRFLRLGERVLVEDALKHLYDCETRGVSCTVASVAGALEVTRGRAVRILGVLEQAGLAVARGEGHVLTDEGRSYALRVLRAHRLLERYLADRTGMRPPEWHETAERLEHRLSSAETEDLARRMGHPLYDPHGDPIPTASGGMPARRGQSLATVAPGLTVRVVHLEDEPTASYQRLLDAGFTLGRVLRVLAVEPERIVFESEGRRSSLAAVLAANVTVEPVSGVVEESGETLADLEVGDRATVLGITARCTGGERRRLLDLGIVPGTVIAAVLRSASGDPIAYEVRGAVIALRREQAEAIRVRRIASGAGAAA
jgi:DtxR family Mn-dependent transcriptional regulator